MKDKHLALITIPLVLLTVVLSVAYAQTIDNSGRREYGYCPISPETMLGRAEFEINGCPLVRVYITNYNQLSTIEKTTIDTQMRASGFRDISEFDERVR